MQLIDLIGAGEGFHENKKVSTRGGNAAKEARVKLEKETGKRVVSRGNYITQQKKIERND